MAGGNDEYRQRADVLGRIAAALDKDISRSCRTIVADERLLSSATRMPYFPLVVERGAGSKVWDADGNEYLDFLASAAALALGHCPESVHDAVKAQLDRFACYNIGYVYHQPLADLAARLTEITPGPGPKRVSFGLSGSDAVDGAYHLARTVRKKPGFLSFDGSYHGVTVGAYNLSNVCEDMKRGCPPVLDGITRLPYPDCYRCPLGCEPADCGLACLDRVEEILRTQVEPAEVAGLIVEPVQGDGGIIVPPDGYLARLAAICRREGILFIAEEIQTGLGRTGTLFAVEREGVIPDILVLGKALGGGLPISALVAPADMLADDDWRSPAHTFTHGGNPLSCVAALATIEAVLAEDLTARASRLGEQLGDELAKLAGEFEIVGDVRGRGLMYGIDIVSDPHTRARGGDLVKKICFRAWENGLILTFLAGSVLRITPALNIPEDALWRGLEIIRDSIKDVLAGKVSDDVLDFAVGR